jgi:hypothetical protein
MREADVLAWLLWQLERIERINAVARMFAREFGDGALAEARRREREARADGTAQEWGRVASVIARWTSERVDVDAPTAPPLLEFAADDAPPLTAPERAQPFRIQFVCGTPDRGPMNLTEKCIKAADKSAAIVAAANTRWPPHTIGLRILDREGREVFARQKAKRR